MTTTADLVISGGTLVFPDSEVTASIAVKDGRIIAIGAADAMPPADDRLDATGMHVLPGAIDSHVHFREPGYTHKEDWGSGTAAAAMGGVTTVFEMPNVNPPTGTAETLRQKHELAAEKAHVDFGIYGLLSEQNLDDLPDLIAGAIDRRHARRVRICRPARLSRCASCRDGIDHGAAPDPA